MNAEQYPLKDMQFSDVIDQISYIVNQLIDTLIGELMRAELNELVEKLRQFEKNPMGKPSSKDPDQATHDSQGKCPNCECDELGFGLPDSTNNVTEYPYTCMQCGWQFKEIWKEIYIKTVAIKLEREDDDE